MSTQSTQPISLTSFVHTTTNDYNAGASTSLRRTRQRTSTNESNSAWQTRTRYSTRSTASNRNQDEDYDDHQQQQQQQQQHPSSSRARSASDDDNDIASNNKRNRIERSDRRISSVNRPNYKVDSDEHEDEDDDPQESDKTNPINDNQDVEQTGKDNEKTIGKKIKWSKNKYFAFDFWQLSKVTCEDQNSLALFKPTDLLSDTLLSTSTVIKESPSFQKYTLHPVLGV